MFHIVKDGKYSIDELVKKSKYFLSIDFSNHGYRSIPFFYFKEPHYDYTEKKILIEEYLDDITEFRIMMVEGKIIYYEKTNPGEDCIQFNKDFQELKDFNSMKISTKKAEKNNTIQRIENFCKEFYKKEKFNLTRMDFYLKKDMSDFYFGEVTFTPENCRYKYSKNFNEYFKKL